MEYPDVYYMPQWVELNAERDDGAACCFDHATDYGRVYYPFLKREIETKINGEIFFDTITPYGFNGPQVIWTSDKERLLAQYETEFTRYCIENNIVAEYVRFSPWLKNHLDFAKYYTLRYNNQTLYVSLEKDFFYEEFSSKTRNIVRKAMKSGVKIEFDFDVQYVDEFNEIYGLTAEKNKIDTYYMFSKEYIKRTLEVMRGNSFIARAVYDDKAISSAIFLYNKEFIHYHLSGNNYNYSSLGANSLILYEVAKWAKECGGINEFHLGGAFQESLLNFKKGFTKNGYLDYYVGTKIRNEKIYRELVKTRGANNSGYFPEYRG